jgi:hypothetical protein
VSEISVDDSILQDFVIESKDHLNVIENGLMAMDDGDVDWRLPFGLLTDLVHPRRNWKALD